MANKHLIGKQVLHLEMGPSENSYALQQRFSDMIWKELSPKLSDLFDRFAGEDEVIRLDKIELDLGEVNLKSSDNDAIIKKILILLEEELFHHKALKTSQDGSRFKHGIEDGEYATRDYMFQLWLHWLANGTFPPYSIKPKGNWIAKVLESLALEHRAVSLLQNSIRKNPLALKRLVLQHKQADLKSLVAIFTGYSQENLINMLVDFQNEILKKARPKKIRSRELEVGIWTWILKQVVVEEKKWDSEAILNAIPDNLITDSKTAEIKIGQEEENHIELESPQFFKNAGMILLHPFLNRFFQKLKLLEDKDFKDFYSQSKAVLLLQYLVTGQEIFADHEMLLPKFLCGMPANLPMDHALSLSKKEKKEADDLLEAAIDNWGALGSTSPNALREGFLIRDGKLVRKDSGWKLIVEPKAMDVLLDRLPWSINIVKLPWMNEFLKVEWR